MTGSDRPSASRDEDRPPFAGRSVCFFAPVDDQAILRRSGFYAQDLEILEELGFDVHIATTFRQLVRADLYFVWWWTWAFKPILFARMTGAPVITTGTFNDRHYDTRPALERALMKFAVRASDANVLVSGQETEWMTQHFPDGRFECVPHGVDTRTYHRAGTARENFCLTICWMALPNCQRKSMFELVRAVPAIRRRVPEFHLKIAGDPRDGGPQLAALAGELGVADAVEFLGVVSEAEKVRLMQSCRLYLQPSRYEGFGLAIAEAMATGAPVVTSAVGAVPEVVGDCGIYVDGSNPAAIADGALRLLLDPEQRAVLSARGAERIHRNFSLKRRRDDLATIMSRVLAS